MNPKKENIDRDHLTKALADNKKTMTWYVLKGTGYGTLIDLCYGADGRTLWPSGHKWWDTGFRIIKKKINGTKRKT